MAAQELDELSCKILGLLYPEAFGEDIGQALLKERETCGLPEEQFDAIVDGLCERRLSEAFAAGYSYRITPQGVLYAEEHQLVSDEVIKQNRNARTCILDELAKLREGEGKYAKLNHEQIGERSGIAPNIIVYNMILLEKTGHLEAVAGPFSAITSKGMKAVMEWREQTALVEKFEEISQMEPHRRGIELQTLFAEIAKKQGWNQEVGVRNSNEELDVIVSSGREYFFVECKWEKSPVETKEVRDFHGKLILRNGVNGIFVSMSGYAEGAEDIVLSYLGSRAILLFGVGDVKSMIYDRVPLEDLIDTKYKLLVTRRAVEFK